MIVAGSLFGVLAPMPLLYAGWNEAAKNIAPGSFYFGELSLPKWPGRVIFLLGLSFCWLRHPSGGDRGHLNDPVGRAHRREEWQDL